MAKRKRIGNLSQIHLVLAVIFVIILGLLALNFIQYKANKQTLSTLQAEKATIEIAYQESSEQKEKLESEIVNLQNNALQKEQEKAELQQIVDDIPPARQTYNASAPLYSFLYEDLNMEKEVQSEPLENVVYLTFDDGPSEITVQVLDILAENNIKATFFVQGVYLNKQENIEILKRAYDEGHSIGVHTDTHVYDDVYSSMTNYLKDYYAVWDKIYQITGEKTALYRFPGGSVNGYSKNIIEDIKLELDNRGLVYFDWNVSSDDAITGATVESIVENATKSKGYSRCVVLMHDSGTKAKTAQALPEIIEYYKNNGYTFDKLTADVVPIQF